MSDISCQPAKSLVDGILYSKPTPKVPALLWGIQHEDKARTAYKELTSSVHDNFTLSITGLHVNVSCPHLGASPDGMIKCSCCGKGILEIKCPYSVHDGVPKDVYFLKETRQHQYYYQVQGQMGILEYSYCDFVVWTPHDIVIERIMFDQPFFDTMKKQLDLFFVKVILPKILIGEKKMIIIPVKRKKYFVTVERGNLVKW